MLASSSSLTEGTCIEEHEKVQSMYAEMAWRPLKLDPQCPSQTGSHGCKPAVVAC